MQLTGGVGINSADYLTVKTATQARLPVGKCRFIASVGPADNHDDVKEFLERIKREYPDATHHAWASRTGGGHNPEERCSDDREPAGTAGPPILGAIRKAGLTGVVLVATRYFGGVKLGVGGLIRAYRACAEHGIKNASIEKKIIFQNLKLGVTYDLIGSIMKIVPACDGQIKNIDYGNNVVIELCIPENKMQEFSRWAADVTAGQIVYL